jgi:hypothetical protein
MIPKQGIPRILIIAIVTTAIATPRLRIFRRGLILGRECKSFIAFRSSSSGSVKVNTDKEVALRPVGNLRSTLKWYKDIAITSHDNLIASAF